MQLESLIDVRNDLANISLGDIRLNRRCQRIAGALQDNPTASFTAHWAMMRLRRGSTAFLETLRSSGNGF
jgi:hypothetical protein